jgi:hypothetical protein
MYLAGNNMAFWEKSDELYKTKTNVKYFDLIQLLTKFDPVMQDHISRVLKGESADHYRGKNIFDELTELIAKRARSKIISCAEVQNIFLQQPTVHQILVVWNNCL